MKKIFTLIFLVVIVISCNENTSVPFGTVQGFVLDGKTGKPLSAAQITTDPPSSSVISNSNGYFQIDNLVNGDYTFKAIHDGYFSATVKAKLLAEKTTKLEILMFNGNSGIQDSTSGTDTSSNYSGAHDASDSPIIKSLKSYLVAYYPFNGDTKDYSGNNLNGKSFKCDYTTNHLNQKNGAIRLNSDQSSFVQVDNPYSFNLSKFTYSFWVKRRSNPGTPYDDYIDVVSRWGSWGAGNESLNYCVGSSGNVKFIYYNVGYGTSDGDSRNYSFVNTGYTMQPETWTHITFTFENNLTRFYLNGSFVNSFSTITPQDSYAYGLMIGSRFDPAHITYFNGDVDELFVFSKVLSDNEINQIFNLGK